MGIEKFYNHIKYFYVFAIIAAYFQLFFPFTWPNIAPREAVTVFYSVENDLAASIAIFIPFLIIDKKGSKWLNWLLILLGFYIIIEGEARIAQISIVLFLILLLWDKYKISLTMLGIGIIISGVNFLNKIEIEGGTLVQLFIDPIEHIINLDPYNLGGSIPDRTDALIYGLTAYINSFGFGIGPGNSSAKLLQDPKTSTMSAESMHNFFAQILVEYGWLIICGIVLLLLHIRKVRSSGAFCNNQTFKFYLICSVLISLSQSEGLFSNYYFFVCLFFSIYYFNIKELSV